MVRTVVGSALVVSAAPIFISLVSMVRDSYKFDEELLSKVSMFLSSVVRTFDRSFNLTNDLLNAIGQDSPNPSAMFVDSMVVLLSSSHPSIFRDTLSFLHRCLLWCSFSNHLALVSSKLIPRILSSSHLQNLSVTADKIILDRIVLILDRGVNLASTHLIQPVSSTSSTDPQSIRSMVLNEVLIPMEPSLVQIGSNRHLLSWNNEFKDTMELLTKIFEVSVFHQPTLDFICSSRIPMAFQSLLSKVEEEDTHRFIISNKCNHIRRWQVNGAET
ncbi:hypothetical protein BLNAU_3155 [Blattamonas nauphoetae]|uniref:Uncharacterized protein n=1 Tax=Blattamonas nauphoetae TaxID=2049346 RepID=A0ABQ9YDF6_9EUKA|nr:hypothetical protein BLNAU_3155 [Blattamonas nauphoetae]